MRIDLINFTVEHNQWSGTEIWLSKKWEIQISTLVSRVLDWIKKSNFYRNFQLQLICTELGDVWFSALPISTSLVKIIESRVLSQLGLRFVPGTINESRPWFLISGLTPEHQDSEDVQSSWLLIPLFWTEFFSFLLEWKKNPVNPGDIYLFDHSRNHGITPNYSYEDWIDKWWIPFWALYWSVEKIT